MYFLCIHILIIFQNHTKHMKAYFIFAIILTVVYILYYTLMIAKDLYSTKGVKKNDEEEFDVTDLEGEESINVIENDEGFNVGENEYQTNYVSSQEQQSNDKIESSQEDVVEKLNEKIKANMEEMQATFSNPYNAAELYKLLLTKGTAKSKSEVDITTKPVIDEL